MVTLSSTEKILALREGGATIRCHTVPYIGTYNVAIHSYNALNLLLVLYDKGQPSINLIKAVLWHDVPERWSGDVPSPAKWSSKLLKQFLDDLEEKLLKRLGLYEPFKSLKAEEIQWLNAIDLLELYLWAMEQVKFGNPNMLAMRKNIMSLFEKRRDQTPPGIIRFVEEFRWTRLPECDELLEEV